MKFRIYVALTNRHKVLYKLTQKIWRYRGTREIVGHLSLVLVVCLTKKDINQHFLADWRAKGQQISAPPQKFHRRKLEKLQKKKTGKKQKKLLLWTRCYHGNDLQKVNNTNMIARILLVLLENVVNISHSGKKLGFLKHFKSNIIMHYIIIIILLYNYTG